MVDFTCLGAFLIPFIMQIFKPLLYFLCFLFTFAGTFYAEAEIVLQESHSFLTLCAQWRVEIVLQDSYSFYRLCVNFNEINQVECHEDIYKDVLKLIYEVIFICRCIGIHTCYIWKFSNKNYYFIWLVCKWFMEFLFYLTLM